MTTRNKLRTTAIAMGLLVAAGCGASDAGEPSLAEVRQSFVKSSNGMRTINGLRALNGLISLNGLTTTNGLRTRNGFRALNGLVTLNGFRTRNGLTIDCEGGELDESCVGTPDGLLDNETGLMSSDSGIETASFVIRCALPAGDSIRIKDYTDTLVTLPGELGLTPEWKDGECDTTCQERISACLMAFTNGDGDHVEIEMSAQFVLGIGHSDDYPFQEASFYGNVFVDPPQAFYCVGADYASTGKNVTQLETRACEGYNEQNGECPYERTGLCNEISTVRITDNTRWGTELLNRFFGDALFEDEKCRFTRTGETATQCKSGSGWGAKTWRNPITTFRKVKQ